MKILININCGSKYCGKCRYIHTYESLYKVYKVNRCKIFNYSKLQEDNHLGDIVLKRLDECINATVPKEKDYAIYKI